MNTTARLRIEEKITDLLERIFNGEGDQDIDKAMDLATLEFQNRDEIKPILKAVFDSCDNAHEVLIGWSNILDDFAKLT